MASQSIKKDRMKPIGQIPRVYTEYGLMYAARSTSYLVLLRDDRPDRECCRRPTARRVLYILIALMP